MPASPKDPSAQNPGEALEQETARIYNLLGATTEIRALVEGYEIDVVVSTQGALGSRSLVECKDHESGRAVSGKEMSAFVIKIEAARKARKAYAGIVVTTSRFSPQARAIAKDYDIQCLTLRELRNQLVDFQAYLQKVVKNFEATNLSRWYVDQTLSEVEDYDALSPEDRKRLLHAPAVDHLERLLKREQSAAILGNVGTGKTSVLEALLARLARHALASPNARIPVRVDLRDFRSGIDIQQAIVYAMQQQGVDISRRLCEELQRLGRFCFLLDGLDEMASKVDRAAINENLRAIDQLRVFGDNKYLLTCRTHFFQERISDEFLTEYTVLYLTEWTRGQLDTYFLKRFGPSGPARCERILQNPHLAALARTPLLLDILLSSDDAQTDRPNVFGLLSSYTDDWITKQSKRRGAVMPPTQRKQFALALAYHMYMENLSTLHFSKLYAIAKDFSGHYTASDIDYFDTDARTCTFITKDSQGNYSFRPRTFFEFFAAEAIASRVEAAEPGALAARELTPEVTSLIAGRGIDDEGVTQLHTWSASFQTEQLSQNAVRLLNALGLELAAEVRQRYGVVDSDLLTFQQEFTGDVRAQLETLAREHWTILHRAARRWQFKTQTMDADDLVQETFIRFLYRTRKDPGTLRSYVSVRAYLLAILRHLGLSYLRFRDHPFQIVSMEDPAVREEIENLALRHPDASGGHETAQLSVEIERAMRGRLSASERPLMRLYLEGHTAAEIADQLGRQLMTVRKQIMRAKRRLLRKLVH